MAEVVVNDAEDVIGLERLAVEHFTCVLEHRVVGVLSRCRAKALRCGEEPEVIVLGDVVDHCFRGGVRVRSTFGNPRHL